jgi:hypothetical protein
MTQLTLTVMTTLEEMGHVMRSAPGSSASPHEVADWYHSKARLLEHLASSAPPDEANRMHALAELAREHADELLSPPESGELPKAS